MLKDILKREGIEQELISMEPHQTVADAARLMKEKNVGTVLVLTEGKPRGILTDRDIVLRCIAENVDVTDCTVENVMTESLETCKETDGLFDCIQQMRKAGVRRIPIVDDKGKAVGILSFVDIARILGKELNALVEGVTPQEYAEGKAAPHVYPSAGKIRKVG